MGTTRLARRGATILLLGVSLALSAPVRSQAQPIGEDALFVYGVSAHAEWEVPDGRYVTRYAAYAVRFLSDVYPGQVHTDVGVLRRRCLVSALKRGGCQFKPKGGVDENVEVVWDPSLSEVTLTFTYRNHEHEVLWRGHGDHTVRPRVYEPPGLVGASAYVIRSATASGSIYGDNVKATHVLQGETYMWEGGSTWRWIGANGWD